MRRDSSGASSPSTLEADWQSRISGSGVVWYHDFRSDTEVDAFRWTNGFSGGNDPNALGTDATRVRRITTDGMASGSCLEVLAGTGNAGQAPKWWRPFAPFNTGSGKAVNDPAASGSLAVRTWAPTSGGSQLSNFTTDWYGHATYANADPTHFSGNDFYLQIVCKMDPRRITGGNQANTVGKFIWFTTAEGAQSLSNAEHVIWSYGHQGNDGAKNYVQVYALGVNGIGSFDPLDQEEPGTRIQPGSDSATDWSYSGGWDVLLIHIRPGLLNTTSGANGTLLEIWAAHEGETAYTKIWNQEYGLSAYQARNGLQALILSVYNNDNSFPQQFYHRYAQVIFSKNSIPCPQVYAGTLPSWASSQADKTWLTPFTSFTTVDSVKPSPLPSGGFTGHFAWSGGRAATYSSHAGMLSWGGGHSDYLGNEVYFYDLDDLRTYRLNNPSAETGGDGAMEWGDGKPRVPHSYKHIVYSPGFMWCTGQAASLLSGGSRSTVWRLDLATLTWTRLVDDWPGTEASTPDGAGFYSATRNKIYVVNQAGEVWSFTPGSGAISMSKICSSFAPSNGLGWGMAYWDAVGLLLYRSDNNTTFSALNVDNAAAGWTTLTVSGTFGASDSYPGMVWHPASKKFLCWGHSSSRADIKTLAPANSTATTFAQAITGTWQTASVAPAGTNTVIPPDSNTIDSAAASGNFHFDLIENFKGSGRDWLMLVNSTTTAPHLYKLPVAGL